MPFKRMIWFLLYLGLVAGLLCSCGSSASMSPPTSDQPSGPADKVEVVYFHRPQRCTKCICFEERVSYVVETYFQDELNSGRLTFQILNLGDKGNAVAARKYSAVGSQLFVNTIVDDVEHIRDVQEIWSWGCTSDQEGFDQAVKLVIERSLDGES